MNAKKKTIERKRRPCYGLQKKTIERKRRSCYGRQEKTIVKRTKHGRQKCVVVPDMTITQQSMDARGRVGGVLVKVEWVVCMHALSQYRYDTEQRGCIT